MNWVRIAVIAAVVAALLLGIKLLRAHDVSTGDAQGAARIQASWNEQKLIDQANSLRLQREASAEQLIKFRNAERISDEQAKREAITQKRIAAGNAVADSLRGTIDQLNQRDAAVATSDPRFIALAQSAATARQLLGICNERRIGVAKEADRLRDQVAGLLDDATQVCRNLTAKETP